MTLQIGWLQLKLRTSFDPDEISSLLEQLHKIDKGKKHSEVCEESDHNVSHKSVKQDLFITSMAAESSDETCESRENNIERQCYVMK